MINFLYKYSILSILSFIFSNFLYFFFEKILHPSLASLVTIVIIFNINTILLFKTKLFKKSKKNYYKLLYLAISFRLFEYLFFNILYLFILSNLTSNYIFVITLLVSYLIKTIIYYKFSIDKKNF